MTSCSHITTTLVDLGHNNKRKWRVSVGGKRQLQEKAISQKIHSTLHAKIEKPTDPSSKITQRPRPQGLRARPCIKIPHYFYCMIF
jgi:hypothetical protein